MEQVVQKYAHTHYAKYMVMMIDPNEHKMQLLVNLTWDCNE